MSKKLLSVLLCVLMVISSISCLFTMSVSAAPGYLYEELFSDGAVETTGGETIPAKLDSIQAKQLDTVNSTYLNKWLRASGGVALGTDLDSTGAVWTAESAETFPTTFGANAQVVSDPTNANNKAIRTVQSLQQYVDSSKIATGNTYTLKFDYINRGPAEIATAENRFDFTFSTPKGTVQTTEVTNEETGETTTEVTGVTVGTAFSSPFTFENFKLLNHSDANLAAGAYIYESTAGIRFNLGSTSNDAWQSVTVQFTLGAENTDVYNTYIDEKVILAAFSQQVSLTDGGDDHALYFDNLSLKLHRGAITGDAEFYNADGVKVDSNDYAGVTVVQNTDGTLTATVDYDKTNKAISFIGWYNGNTAMGYDESITFAGDGSVLPTPRFLTYNRLSELGSFEYETTGDHLAYVEAVPESGKAPNYPVEGTWGIVCNNGYITYTDVSNSASKVANTYADTIYKTDGTAVSQTEHQGRKVSSWTQDTNLTVVDTVAHSGSKSFEIKSADMAYVSGITTEKAGTYILSYYVNDVSAIKAASGKFATAILSTANIGVNRTGSDVYYDDSTKSATVTGQLPNHMSSSHGDWASYVFERFRNNDNLANVTLEDGQTWYKVTHTFTTTENHQKVYFAIYNNTGAKVYIDDVTCYNSTDFVSYFGSVKAVKDDMVTEIPNANLPVSVELSNAQIAGVPVTATVNYDTTDKSMKFVGWYNGDELVSEDATITVTPAAGDNYYPKFVTLNILAGAASYENFEVGEHLGYAANTPTETDGNGNLVEPIYGDNIRWSWNFNGGYITSNNGSESSFAQNVYAGTVYGNDGTAYTLTQSTGTRNNALNTNYPSYVTTDKAYSGEKSVALKASVARSLSIPVEAGKTYKLSFYTNYAATNAVYYAVSTTVNLGSSVSGYGLGHLTQPTNDAKSGYDKYRLAQGTVKEPGVWAKSEATFTVPENTDMDAAYLVLFTKDGDTELLYIDDICCIEVTDNVINNIEFLDVDGNISTTDENIDVNAELINNLDGTYTASVTFENNGVYVFDGWYDTNNNCVSTDIDFTFATGTYKASDLKAVIIDRNILTDAASFETYSDNEELRTSMQDDLESNAPTTKYWGVSYQGKYFSDDYFAISAKGTVNFAPTEAQVTAYYEKAGADKFAEIFGENATVESVAASLADTIVPHSGDRMIALYTKYRSSIRKIEGLKANTDYILTFYTYMNSANDRVNNAIVSNVYDGIYSSALDTLPEGAEVLGMTNIGYTATEYRTWKKVTVAFNSGNNTEAYIHLHVNSTDNNSIFAPAYIDDMVIAEPTTIYNGTAIRAAAAGKPQALRYKFSISNEFIANAYADWEVEEYGSIAIRTYYLNGQELTLDGEYYGDGKERNVVKGVAYNKTEGKDIIFAKDTVNTQFTAALTGIGRKSNGSTNYLAWGDKYSVRNYIILKKGDKTLTIYGEETAVASVFDVMEAILEGDSAEDIATVNSILYDANNGEAIRTAFATRKGYELPETVE